MHISWRRYTAMLLAVVICCSAFAASAGGGKRLKLQSDAAIVIDQATGRTVYEDGSTLKRYPASTTKIMTCLLALEDGHMDRVVTVSHNAANVESTQLHEGDQMTMKEMLYEMMLVSDNGAAIAIAESIAGSVPAFADRMNRRAHDLGMGDTRFVNPNGLHNDRHFSSARDIAKLARAAMERRDFREIVGTKRREITWLTPNKTAVLQNTNELLGKYQGMTGIKTGYTDLAGGCLASGAERGKTKLVAVVLHAPDEDSRFTDTRKLLDYGFDHLKDEPGRRADDMEQSVWIAGGDTWHVHARPKTDLTYPVLKGERHDEFTVKYDIPRFVNAPVKAGDEVGYVVLQHKGKEVCRVPLLADGNVQEGFSLVGRLLHFFFG